MLTVYKNDIEGFGKEDWGDMLDNPNVPIEMRSAWENWNEDKQVVFKIDGFDPFFHCGEWESFPVKEFMFDLEHEGEKVEYSEELSALLGDLVHLNDVKQSLYHLMLFDRDFEAEMDGVSDSFCGAYDKALARALAMLLGELYAARKEQ